MRRVPDHLRKEVEDVLVREISNLKIVFKKKNDNDQEEDNILDRYHILIAYVKKPSCKEAGTC